MGGLIPQIALRGSSLRGDSGHRRGRNTVRESGAAGVWG